MTSLYNDLDISFTNAIDGIDVDRLSMPSSPTTPSRQRNGVSRNGSVSSGLGDGGSGGGAGDNGLGSLADELAALSDYDDDEEEEGEEDEYVPDQEGQFGGNQEEAGEGEDEVGEAQEDIAELQHSGDDLANSINGGDMLSNNHSRRRSSTITSNSMKSSANGHSRTKSKASTILSSPKSKRRSGAQSRGGYNPDADSDDDESIMEQLEGGISFGLQEKLDQIERLAAEGRRMKFGKSLWAEDSGGGGRGRIGSRGVGSYELNGGHVPTILHDEEDGEGRGGVHIDMDPDVDVIPRLMNGLQQLQPQTTMETGASRLITAHAALSNHMYNESRTLRDLSLSLHSSALPLPDTSDLLTSLIDLIPRPPIHPLNELSSLRSVTAQLVAQLAFLSDTLHMARQSSIAANRKLRVAREACAEWKGELEMAERGRRWIEDGDWVGKCSRREAAGVCGEVMEGFERVCVGVEKEMKAMLTV